MKSQAPQHHMSQPQDLGLLLWSFLRQALTEFNVDLPEGGKMVREIKPVPGMDELGRGGHKEPSSRYLLHSGQVDKSSLHLECSPDSFLMPLGCKPHQGKQERESRESPPPASTAICITGQSPGMSSLYRAKG